MVSYTEYLFYYDNSFELVYKGSEEQCKQFIKDVNHFRKQLKSKQNETHKQKVSTCKG